MYIKAPKPEKQKMYDFLEELRQSGQTNMFGAGQYLKAEFGLDRDEASAVLSDWMEGHSDKSRHLKESVTGYHCGAFVTTYEPGEEDDD